MTTIIRHMKYGDIKNKAVSKSTYNMTYWRHIMGIIIFS